MTLSRPAHATNRRIRRRRLRTAGAIVALAAIAAVLGARSLVPASLTISPPSTASWPSAAASPVAPARSERRDALGEAGGGVPDGTTVFDDDVPSVAHLDPALLRAARRAATDAAAEGVDFVVDSGWRSPAYQARLLREAISKYGSEQEAERWVATPATSAHVSGDAIDFGPAAATAWLSAHGAAYGLCRIYANEPWHYELRPEAAAHGCPPMYANPTEDPRMHQ